MIVTLAREATDQRAALVLVLRRAEKLTSVALPGVRQSDQIKLAAVVNTMAQMEHQKRGRRGRRNRAIAAAAHATKPAADVRDFGCGARA